MSKKNISSEDLGTGARIVLVGTYIISATSFISVLLSLLPLRMGYILTCGAIISGVIILIIFILASCRQGGNHARKFDFLLNAHKYRYILLPMMIAVLTFASLFYREPRSDAFEKKQSSLGIHSITKGVSETDREKYFDGQRSSPEHFLSKFGNGIKFSKVLKKSWVRFEKPINIHTGQTLCIKVSGSAKKVLARLRPVGAKEDHRVGFIKDAEKELKPLNVRNGMIYLPLDENFDNIAELAVYSGSEQWGVNLGAHNGLAKIDSLKILNNTSSL